MQNKMKSAFTMAEALVSMLIISVVGMAAMHFTSSYLKTTYERDQQIKVLADNMNTAETLRAGVTTLPLLYEFSQGKEMKITAVGIGEIEIMPDGSYTIISPDSFEFSENIRPRQARLFKIEIGGDEVPNTKITTVVNLE